MTDHERHGAEPERYAEGVFCLGQSLTLHYSASCGDSHRHPWPEGTRIACTVG